MRSGGSDHRIAQELTRPLRSLVAGKVRHARVVGNCDQCDRLCRLHRHRDLSPIARQQIAGSLSAERSGAGGGRRVLFRYPQRDLRDRPTRRHLRRLLHGNRNTVTNTPLLHASPISQRPAHAEVTRSNSAADRAVEKKTPFVLLERTGGAFSGTAAALRNPYSTSFIAADPMDRAPLSRLSATHLAVEPFWRHPHSSKKVLP